MMKNKKNLIGIVAALGVAATSCGGSSGSSRQESSANDSIPIPETIVSVTDAVRNNNAEKFASLVSYPLVRPYPLHDILSEEEMKSYYPVLVDDSLRHVLTNAPDTSWNENGWRGWTLDNGQYMWIDESVYDIPYISGAERRQLAELEKRELESIPKKYRKGWKPLGCMRSRSSGAVYRIDRNPKAHPGHDYRMMVWNDSTRLNEDPAAVFVGRCQTEGSAEVRTYFFASKNGAKAVYVEDVSSMDESPRILFTDTDGVNHADTVSSAYWLDLTAPRDTIQTQILSHKDPSQK